MPGLAALEALSPAAGVPEARWCKADVERAIAAAEQAGLTAYRVEISPDGTIAIVVGPQAEAAGRE